MTSTWWSTICSAIEPRPPAAFVSSAHVVRVSAGPWQARLEMCEAMTAGVASVISAVETSPVVMPAFRACSRTVGRSLEPGTSRAVLGPCEIRSSIVLLPVAHAVPVEAESGT